MWLLLLLFFITEVVCVDRSNFKTCADSSFCTRQRSHWPAEPEYYVDAETVHITGDFVHLQIFSSLSQKRLNATLTYHKLSTFRLVLDDAAPIRPRFRPRIGDSLFTEPDTLSMKTSITKAGMSVTGYHQEEVVITFNPFKAMFLRRGNLELTLNDRDLFYFEHHLEKQFVEPISQPQNQSLSEGESENTENQDTPEQQATEPVPVDWSESFKGQRDSRPHGPASVGIDCTFHGFEHVYGIPEHADSFALRNTNQTDPYRLYNLDVFEYELNNPMALYGSVPLMWAHKVNSTVGLFINNPSEAWIDVESSRQVESGGILSKLPNLFSKSSNSNPTVKTRWIFETGVLDMFVILAENPHDGLKAYASLTGTTPLPPLFALAHHQCRWNYKDQAEVKAVNDGYNKHNLPMDVVWLDIEYADDKRYLTWSPGKFPTPNEMVDDLAASGRKLVVIVDPHIKADHSWSTCSKSKSEGYLVKKEDGQSDFDGWCWPGSSYWPDFYRPEVVNWWADLLTDDVFLNKDKMFYSWNDMNEPSVFSGPEVTIPKDTIFGGVWENRDIHNLYGLWVHNATTEGLLRRSNYRERPFVLSRAFFAGSQRFGAVWTGDNKASWGHLEITTPMLLSLSMTGLTFCGSDVGGFFGHPSGELYTRWYQAAAFHPFLRSHAHIDTPKREPWTFDQQYHVAVRDALRLRYSLLPYWYTLFARSEHDNRPPMAPLFFEFPNDANTFAIDNQFMVGEALLVHPVVHEGATSVDVYLPKGTWFLHGDWKVFSGEQVVNFPVDLGTIPLFYRGGHIIPKKARPRRSSSMMLNDPYTIVVSLDAPTDGGSSSSATGFLYRDDFHSMDRAGAHFHRIDWREGVLEFTRLPLPGHHQHDHTARDDAAPFIERIVFLGVSGASPRRAYVTTANVADSMRPVEFFFSPAGGKGENGSRSGLLVIRKPEVRATDGWKLHVEV
ncbi:unnamed protein product [Mesocestoides corti]|uniref:Glucosidase II subunit alpha n=1 Tax=Mesocestoides corti TaxID=53468 RepID=A0A0R3UJZ2_MESCO|nr:unnamed protein product [Mesocestoides corti]